MDIKLVEATEAEIAKIDERIARLNQSKIAIFNNLPGYGEYLERYHPDAGPRLSLRKWVKDTERLEKVHEKWNNPDADFEGLLAQHKNEIVELMKRLCI